MNAAILSRRHRVDADVTVLLPGETCGTNDVLDAFTALTLPMSTKYLTLSFHLGVMIYKLI